MIISSLSSIWRKKALSCSGNKCLYLNSSLYLSLFFTCFIDSGHSTLPPAEDYYPDSEANPKSLDYETREAIRRLDSVVGRSPEISPGETPVASLRQRPPSSCSRGPLPAFEQQGELDRDMEEVSRAAEDAVGEGGEGNGDNKNRVFKKFMYLIS